jgi:Sigma-70, region 4
MYRAFARTGVDPAEDGVAERASDRASAAALGPRLAKALASLRAQDRDAVLLLAWGEMSYAEIAATTNVGKSAANHYTVDSRQRSIIWIGPDGKGRIAIVGEAGRPVTPQDMIKWRQAGSPKMVDVPNPDGPQRAAVDMQAPPSAQRLHGGKAFDGNKYFGLTAGQVAKLPTDAKALENVLLNLKGDWHAYSSQPEQEPIRALRGAERTRALSDVAGTLLSQAPAPPRVQAAAFRMLATLPGVKAQGTAADPMGRTGRVISLPLATTVPLGLYTAPKQLGTYRRQWIIDPADGRLLAIRDLVATPPHGSRALPPGDDGKPRRLKAKDMPDRFHRPGEVSSYQVFAVAEWTNTPPK